jgi:uncharacterized protein with von Willebrand factor type A (vWA) domain
MMNFSATDYRPFISTRTLTDRRQQHIRATSLLAIEMETLTIANQEQKSTPLSPSRQEKSF